MRWFGESWGAPINEELPSTETPVGKVCLWCDEPIELGDRGIEYPDQVAHVECWMRQVLGGVNHIEGRCSCKGGSEPPDPPHMTKREAALAAIAAAEAQR